MRIRDAIPAMEASMAADIPTFLWGPPGVGKSDIVRAHAKKNDLNMVDFRANLRDPVDLRGLPLVKGDTTRWLPPSDLPHVDRDGPEGILFLDELNTAAPSVQAACFGLVLDRKVGEYTLPPGWRIVAAGNRQQDRAAAQAMPTALANRFCHLTIDADVDDFARWGVKNGIDERLLAFLRFRAELIHVMPPREEQAFPSPRSWERASRIMSASDSVRYPLLVGNVGSAAAAELLGFLKVYKDLPSLKQIVEHPDSTIVPDEPAAKFAVATMLGNKITAQNFASARRYLKRVGPEYDIMAVIDCTGRDEALYSHAEFVRFSQENADVFHG